MTRYEKIKQELTIEKVAKWLDENDDCYCFEVCKNATGHRHVCPHKNKIGFSCYDCAMEWLNMEVGDEN